MSDPSEKDSPLAPSPGEEEIIELIEVVEDPHQETVLEFVVEDEDLDSLMGTGAAARKKESAPLPEAEAGDQEESLDDFLASLPDLSEESPAPALEAAPPEAPTPEEPPAPEVPSAPEAPSAPEVTPTLEAAPTVAAVSPEGLRQQVESALSPEQLQEMVREVVQETVDRLARELFPQVAAEVLDQHLTALKKRLLEEG